MHNCATLWHHSNHFSARGADLNGHQNLIESSKPLNSLSSHRSAMVSVYIFDPTKRTYVRPDWSHQGIGYFLSQKHCSCDSCLPDCCTDGWRVTLTGSRFLTSAEQRYAPIEGEAIAVAWGLEQCKYFTQECNDLLVVTDHKPLVKILGDRTLEETSNTRIFRLKQRMLPWSFDIAHLPGKPTQLQMLRLVTRYQPTSLLS